MVTKHNRRQACSHRPGSSAGSILGAGLISSSLRNRPHRPPTLTPMLRLHEAALTGPSSVERHSLNSAAYGYNGVSNGLADTLWAQKAICKSFTMVTMLKVVTCLLSQ